MDRRRRHLPERRWRRLQTPAEMEIGGGVRMVSCRVCVAGGVSVCVVGGVSACVLDGVSFCAVVGGSVYVVDEGSVFAVDGVGVL